MRSVVVRPGAGARSLQHARRESAARCRLRDRRSQGCVPRAASAARPLAPSRLLCSSRNGPLVQPVGVSALHDHFDRAANAHEEGGQAIELRRDLSKNPTWPRVRIVMPNINDHVQSQPAVRSYGLVHRGVEHRHQRLDVRSLATRAKPDPGKYRFGVTQRTNTSTPRFIQGPSKLSWMAVAIRDLPDLGGPFKTTICPGSAMLVSKRVRSRSRHHQGLSLQGKC